MLGSVGNNHGILGKSHIGNILYQIRIVKAVIRFINDQTGKGIHIVNLQRCFPVLRFFRIGIGKGGFAEEALLIPAVHHFQEFRCFIILIIGKKLGIVFHGVYEKEIIGRSLYGIHAVVPHEQIVHFRTGGVYVIRLKFRTVGFNQIHILFHILKGFHLTVPVHAVQDIGTVHGTVCGVGRKQCGHTVVMAVDSRLLFGCLRLHRKVFRCIGRPQLIQVHECTLLCQGRKIQPGSGIGHIKGFS